MGCKFKQAGLSENVTFEQGPEEGEEASYASPINPNKFVCQTMGHSSRSILDCVLATGGHGFLQWPDSPKRSESQS